MLRQPAWYGRSYPSIEDMEEFAASMGAAVIKTRASVACYWPGDELHASGIFIPDRIGPLEGAWLLAHELGHLVQHAGPRGELLWAKDERTADRWAACALIPEAAVRRHQNACEDSFVAALSRHFEDLPPIDCPSRRLAGKIAAIRLKAFMEVTRCGDKP